MPAAFDFACLTIKVKSTFGIHKSVISPYFSKWLQREEERKTYIKIVNDASVSTASEIYIRV